MPCQKCNSKRILDVNAKCSDLCHVTLNGKENDGYVPDDLGIGGGDYVEFKLCLDCGQIQGKFPLPKTELEEAEDDSPGSDLNSDDFFVPGVSPTEIASTAEALFGQTTLSSLLLGVVNMKETSDITMLKHAEQQVKYQAMLLAHVSDAIIATDMQYNIQYWNAYAEQQYGWKAEDVIGRPLENFIINDYLGASLDAILLKIKRDGFWKGEVTQNRRDGVRISVLSTLSIITDDNNQPIGFIAVNRDITERKLAENALKESEQRYQRITEEITDYVYTVTVRDGRAVETRHGLACKSVTGYTAEDFAENPNLWIGMVPPEERDRVVAHAQKILTGEDLPAIEHRIIRKNGQIRWVSDKSVVHLDSNNVMVSYEGIICDITEQKLTEKSLQESESRYRTLFEQANDAIWILDLAEDRAGQILLANPAAAKMHGYSITEMEKLRITDLDVPDSVARAPGRFGDIKKGEWISGETLHMRKDGTIFPIEFSAGPITFDGRPCVLAFSRDITKRMQAEALLRESEKRLHEAQKLAHLGVWDWQAETDTVTWTEELYTIAGLDPMHPAPTYKEHPNLYTPVSWELLKNGVERAMKTGEPYQFELELIRPDGDTRHVNAFGGAKYDAKGQVNGLFGTVQDITERKRMEEELQKAQKLQSLGILAAGIAHNFNNLMGGIFGYIDMARVVSQDSKVTTFLSKAINSIDRARGLTGQLLTFAKGGAPLQQTGNLFPFVQETAQFALSGSSASCHFDVPQDLWACNFDKNQIGQVIDNIIINAQQAMPVGGTIELTARNIALEEKEHPLLANGNYVSISVKDTGVGIPKELISKIFDPFFTTKAKGHGLGLATCYSIVKRHEGCIDVESEPGKGSTFKVYLPASTESASAAIKKTAKTHKGSGTFLVMDDEEVMRDTIGDMLGTLGYKVVSKENGKDAIDFYASETKANRKITGMIFDLTVPGGMSGKEAVAEIRKLNTEIPVFVASGYADDPVIKKPTEYGFTGSICKPFNKAELVELLSGYLTKQT